MSEMTATPLADTGNFSPAVADYVTLLKPRVMSLVVFTGFVGLYLAPGRIHPVLAVVAVRLLSAKMLARSRPESFEASRSFGPEMLALLEKKLGRPPGGWTNRNVIIATARLGGFLARKHDGMPGWQTIWRGWQRLIWMCEGLAILTHE